MPFKRKYESDADFSASEVHPQSAPVDSSPRRLLSLLDAPAGNMPSQPQKDLSQREKRRKARFDAELVNLADYDAPPKPRGAINETDGEDDSEPPRSVRARNAAKDVRVTKVTQKPKSKPPRKRTKEERLLAELVQLTRWPGWASEDEQSSSDIANEEDSDNEAVPLPCTHTRNYPPKEVSVQNSPWSELPGELRNRIYEYYMANEEEKTLNVVHYPKGVPRRSVRGISASTNFAHSFWGFTQTCRQVREEFAWWLLEKRKVRTPLATLNDYVETFHRPHPTTGKVIGHVEPLCTEAALPGVGVEIVRLLKLDRENEQFHLQLTPSHISSEQLALQMEASSRPFDELNIVEDIGKLYAESTVAHFSDIGLILDKLRNYTYELAVGQSSKSTELFYRFNSNSQRLCNRYWGFMSLTQTNRLLRSEFRPFYMSRLDLTIELPDVPTFVNTFLSNILEEPGSAPQHVRIRLDQPVDCCWYAVYNFNITPLLSIMATIPTAHVFEFCVREWQGDWLSPLLNRVGKEYKETWREALRNDIHEVRLCLRDQLAFKIVMKNGVSATWADRWTPEDTGSGEMVWLDEDPAVLFQNSLGLRTHDEIAEVLIPP
ncbi:hypothetical protein EK21DRAFT_112780 [Setomelanomma holmii]|uniref:Uncharacterized protein n=1 Tax=Setomelanomma holmii TaxID=210430 RepID=A0A9P4H9L0_9PLEO|nr:hypothetical protein EK21DRAFT_112780 [Setomelanomma holmii]